MPRFRRFDVLGRAALLLLLTPAILAANLPAPQLSSPPNGSSGQSTVPTFIWSSVPNSTSYRIMVATSSAALTRDVTVGTCGSCIVNDTTTNVFYTPQVTLSAGTTYYWEVHGRSPSQFGDWSAIWSFTTATPTLSWSTPPPSTVTAGSSFNVAWTLNGTAATPAHMNVHWDPSNPETGVSPNCFLARVSCSTFSNTSAYTANITAPTQTINGTTLTTNATIYYVVHAIVNGTDYYSPRATVTVTPAGQPHIRIEPTSMQFVRPQAPSMSETTAAATAPHEIWRDPERLARLKERAGVEHTVRVIVRLRDAAAPDKAERRRKIAELQDEVIRVLGSGSTVLRRMQNFPYLFLEVTQADLLALATHPDVRDVDQDVVGTLDDATSNDTINIAPVWNAGYTANDRTIAVLDSGIDMSHGWFSGAGKIVRQACFSGGVGISFCPGHARTDESGGGGPCSGYTQCDHGTHVAGIAAGASGDSNAGVANGARLVSIQVNSGVTGTATCAPFASPCAQISAGDLIAALDFVNTLRETVPIDVVNMSIGFFNEGNCFPGSMTFRDAAYAQIGELVNAGVAVVASSGNNNSTTTMTFPACAPGVISVGATMNGNALWKDIPGGPNGTFFGTNVSNAAGSRLTLLAPGTNIQSAATPGGGLQTMSGTSMAAPHVSGALAVLRQAKPSATMSELVGALQVTGTAINDPRLDGQKQINVGAAYDLVRQIFTVNNDGDAPLVINSITPDSPASWIQLTETSGTVAAHGFKIFGVVIDYNSAPNGASQRRLLVQSNDATASPYPNGVYVNVTNNVTNYTLQVTRTGSGSGTVTSTPAGIDCGATCSAPFASGTPVTLHAAAGAGSTFTGWTGGICEGVGDCQIMLTASAFLNAQFDVPAPTISNVSPNWGPDAGGTTLTVTGTNFTGQGIQVTVGGTPCTNVSASNSTQLTAITGAHAAGAADVVVTTASGEATASNAFTYVAPLAKPTNVSATATSTTTVSVTWNAVPGADHYAVIREDGGSAGIVGTPFTNAFTDSDRTPSRSYVYRVRAIGSQGDASPDSDKDFATTILFTDPTLTQSTTIKAIHLDELRAAINAVRGVAGMPAATFTDPTLEDVPVKAVHINELRTLLDEARAVYAFPALVYANAVTAGVPIRAVDLMEIRNAVK